jgi:hypothetical protein
MIEEAEIWEGQGLGALRRKFPWVAETYIFPSAPVTVIYSGLRDGKDSDRCCAKINQMLELCRYPESEHVYLISGRKLWPGSNIVLRRRGHWSCDMEPDSRSSFSWTQESIASCNNQDVALAVGCLAQPINAKLALFAIRYSSVFLLGHLSQGQAVEWLKHSAAHICSNDDTRLDIKLNLPQCLTLFPSDSASGAIFHGNDDFGGFFCFCFGKAFKSKEV